MSVQDFNELLSNKKSWICPECCRGLRKNNNDQTPVRHQAHDGSTSSLDTNWVNKGPRGSSGCNKKGDRTVGDFGESSSQQDLRGIVQSELRTFHLEKELVGVIKTTMSREFHSLKKELKEMKEEVTGIKEAIDFFNTQFEELKEDSKKKTVQIAELQKENETLKFTTRDLHIRVMEMEQHARAANIEVQCVPEFKSENPVVLIQQLAKVVSCDINASDIHFCTRIAK